MMFVYSIATPTILKMLALLVITPCRTAYHRRDKKFPGMSAQEAARSAGDVDGCRRLFSGRRR